ncbi:pyridoxal phosphate-dependent aminotransferase [Fulvivirga lutimaris]|uniref:pyridoxal phosphate-dependent aminotransferase n=1 Tax=Fulvivirga lutimaris TaxID=1819566 RepID=UPI0012BC39A3|nr:pyridoxal phosphate-dependent aminotransferase [Fulvivirga lutimaris]MTI41538.1 pyridoxal phosphate-dependent aminotransferase [Fulvivirga lutimaris]
MRQNLLRQGADELSYEIRGIVKKAEQLQALGYTIHWENIGDPIQKNRKLPEWMKETIIELLRDDKTYGYSHSKGLIETRQFLAEKNNELKGTQIGVDDITFFNGLGDAIAKIYQFLTPSARVIGPSPAYSTHSSAEAAHANAHPVTYNLDPENSWYPDLDDLYMKVKYNTSIVGILVINPDNPTGMVYPRHILERIVAIAKEFDLFLIFDEIYQNIVYNNASTASMAEVIGDVPGISLKGISKEFPWPGSRCGWAEYYNRTSDSDFNKLCSTIDNAKMIEVSSTTLPQRAIPKVMSDPRYTEFLKETNEQIGQRSKYLTEMFADVEGIQFNLTNGAFYNTIIFKKNVLHKDQSMVIEDEKVKSLLDNWLADDMPFDKRFVYYLLAAKQVCVVPISAFASDLLGFRMTLLEADEQEQIETYKRIKDGLIEYLNS